MKKFYTLGLAALLMPVVTYAQDAVSIIDKVGEIIGLLIPIAAGIALVVFFWGLVRFIYKADSESDREAGKKLMIWGVIALFVMMSIWGIIFFLQESFGLARLNSQSPPCINIPGSDCNSDDGLPSCVGQKGGAGCPAGSR